MKKSLFLLILMMSFSLKAITFEVIGPCDSSPLYEGDYEVKDFSRNAGQLTLAIFKKLGINFRGHESMIKDIEGIPGENDYLPEEGGDYKILGWCYEVNGLQPAFYINKFFFSSNDDHLKWILGYAHFKDGHWTQYCKPSFTLRPPLFCGTK